VVDDPRPDDLTPVKRALVELRELRARLDELERARTEPIAIVGLGCRFPGAASPDAFWRLLHDGVDAITEVPRDRWDADALNAVDRGADEPPISKHGGFLDGVDRFDAYFFGITPREAAGMDPQQRLLLEVAWEALEHAGLAPDRLAGTATGVFVGIAGDDYAQLRARSEDPARADGYFASGVAHSMAAGRLSYVLGFNGPSLSIDTACSSSLVGVHAACQSLRQGECRLALAGGVNLVLVPDYHVALSRARMLAADGRCKTFDASADGYVRGEGCGVVVLKRLSDAVADRDRVLAVVRGSAVNQDGRTSGLTVPNGPAQEALIRAALAAARTPAADVSYVEAHGTGTSLGDPIELQALAAALGAGRTPDRPLLVGSVKTNIGHLEPAAGVAGLIKVVLAMQHREIPAHLHFRHPNPHVRWEALPIAIVTERRPWSAGGKPLVAGVSSFGFSGTNAHLIVEEGPGLPSSAEQVEGERPLHLLALSAKTAVSLDALAASYRDHLDATDDAIADICHTANAGRSHFGHRAAFIGASRDELRRALAAAPGDAEFAPRSDVGTDGAPPIAFLFTGQGAQYAGMGRRLYDTEPTFRRAIDRCDALLRSHLDRPLASLLFAGDAERALAETEYAQPALFAVEFALAELWRSWGIEPAFVMGHSLGELTAACVAGVFDLEGALELVAARGRAMQAIADDGEMVSVCADEASVRAAVAEHRGRVSIAAVNAPDAVVISGVRDAVWAIAKRFDGAAGAPRSLSASRAFHSPLVDPVLPALEQAAARIACSTPRIPMVLNATGGLATGREVTTGSYWARHAREPVRFSDGVQELYRRGCRVFVEIGPTPVLLSLASRSAGGIVCVPSLRKDRDDWRQMLEGVAALYTAGARVDWAGFDRDYQRRRVVVPSYPFERERYWIETAQSRAGVEPFEQAVEEGRRQAANGPLGLDPVRYAKQNAHLDALSAAYMSRTLADLGAFRAVGEHQSLDDVMSRCGIVDRYRKLVERWLACLVEDQFLAVESTGVFVSRRAFDREAPTVDAAAEAVLFGDDRAVIDHVRQCGVRLAEMLTGRGNPLELLFPDGSFEVAESLYEKAFLARYTNGIAHAVLQGFLAAMPDSRPLRAVEIGAGTGGLTSALLPALAPRQVPYWFTDLSDLFLVRAQEKFARYPFVRYAKLDISSDPAAQAFPRAAFDLVVASNVLHATKDLRETIARAASLLAPGGLLLVCEVTRDARWLNVSSPGLIEGWNLYEDDVRRGNPLLAPDVWRRLLLDGGFERAVQFPGDGEPGAVVGQHIIAARWAGAGEARAAVVDDGAREWERTGAAARPAPASQAADELIASLVASPPADRIDRLTDFVREEIVRIMRIDRARVGATSRLVDLGVDSLMAVELRNRIKTGLAIGRALPATLVFDYPTAEAIAKFLANDVLQLPAPAEERRAVRPSPAPAAMSAEAVDRFSEEEIEELLLRRLETLNVKP
jgi:acyl transferase domain-containing protein/SAM-dependent methyltransferase/acyl carrier protein